MINIYSAEEAAELQEQLIPLQKEQDDLDSRIEPIKRRLERWFSEWSGGVVSFGVSGWDYENRKQIGIWTDIPMNNVVGLLEPIPKLTSLSEVESIRNKMALLHNEMKIVEQSIEPFVEALEKWVADNKRSIKTNLKKWYDTCTTYQLHTDTPLYLSAGANSYHLSTEEKLFDFLQWGFNPALTPNDVLAPGTGSSSTTVDDDSPYPTALKYIGTTTQYVYTPKYFKYGSSLSHFEDQYNDFLPASFTTTPSNNQYFVMSNASPSLTLGGYDPITNPGVMKRHPTPEERAALCDIGYSTGTVFGDPANLNYFDYGGSDCAGIQVAGINDGINSVGAYTFVSASYWSPSVDINGGSAGSILDNDFGADAFKCLEVISGGGTLSTDHGTATTPVTFSRVAGFTGVQLLRYIPYNTITHVEGNITYIYVYVVGDCVPTACDMVSNGGFENTTMGAFGSLGQVYCWNVYSASPDLYSRGITMLAYNIPNTNFFDPSVPNDGHPYSSGTNNHFWGMEGQPVGPTGPYYAESISNTLTSPLIPGEEYHISFWAREADKDLFHPSVRHFIVGASPFVALAALPDYIYGLAPGIVPVATFTVENGADTISKTGQRGGNTSEGGI